LLRKNDQILIEKLAKKVGAKAEITEDELKARLIYYLADKIRNLFGNNTPVETINSIIEEVDSSYNLFRNFEIIEKCVCKLDRSAKYPKYLTLDDLIVTEDKKIHLKDFDFALYTLSDIEAMLSENDEKWRSRLEAALFQKEKDMQNPENSKWFQHYLEVNQAYTKIREEVNNLKPELEKITNENENLKKVNSLLLAEIAKYRDSVNGDACKDDDTT